MKRKFFFRRAALFFALMLIPTLIVFGCFMVVSVQNMQSSLLDKGTQTVASALDNCEMMINETAQQNDLLTGTTRMTMSLNRALNQVEMSYSDSIFLSALGAMLRSIVDSNDVFNRIDIWLDDAPRVFSSQGSNIQEITQAQHSPWMDAYLNLPQDQLDTLVATTAQGGGRAILSIRRLLLQKGCTVVSINAEKWEGKLTSLLQSNPEHLVLLDAKGELLLHATNDKEELPKADGEWVQTLMNAASGAWIHTSQGRFLITRSTMGQLQIISAIPQEAMNDTLRVLLQSFLGILMVDLCVVVLLAYITTKRICDQMMLMIDMLDNAVKGLPVQRPERKTHDEYDVIMNNILYMYLKDNALRAELQEKQYQKENAELMALQLQINPHFLYNTLQTLDISIRGGKADYYDLCDIIRSVSDILKYALSNPQEPVTLRDEVHYLKEYAAVQKFRFGGRFVLYYEIEEALMECQVFRLMLQPLVENCMIHGLKELSERGYIWVEACRKDERLFISVRDSGAGMDIEKLQALKQRMTDDSSRSIGLANLNRRLLLRYGEASALDISSEPGAGMEVSFSIPYQMEVEEKVSIETMNDKE